MRNKKYIYASESTIEEIIYRRNGHLNHPERFHITSAIVSNLIHRLYKEKPLEIPGEDWITFFKRFGKLVTITTVNLLEVLVVGIPMFLRIPKNDHKIKNKVYHDITLTTLLYRDYSRIMQKGTQSQTGETHSLSINMTRKLGKMGKRIYKYSQEIY